MMLPKELAEEGVESDVRAVLERESTEIQGETTLSIPVLKLNAELRKSLFYAKCMEQVLVGYDAIVKSLAGERFGLQKVDNQSERVSRMLLVTNDGSPRFYRELVFLNKKHGERVLICLLDMDGLALGRVLGLRGRAVKAMLLNRKAAVVNVLKSLR
ncbi:MAG: hypothetical protein HQ523_16790 [Lentisphaerae bacterium]|nr:hypothetical protein [Lentisphaerota bacterium]